MRVYKVTIKDSFSGQVEYIVTADSDVHAERVVIDLFPTCRYIHSELLSVRGVIDGSNYQFSKK